MPNDHKATAEKAHLRVVARIIRECANDIGMNEPRYADRLLDLAEMAEREAEGQEPVCRCDWAYIGTQMAGEPIRCERCRGLVDEVAQGRLEVMYAEARDRLMGSSENPTPPAKGDSDDA